MAQVITNSGHDDMIHDAVLDYYGRRLATCSSDKTIKIFEVEGDQHKLTETLRGHEGAVWCVSWVRLTSPVYPSLALVLSSFVYPYTAPQEHIGLTKRQKAHPKYGTILASSSYDGKVFIWRESPSPSPAAQQGGGGAASQWTRVADFSLHSASVNIVSWSPHESGCLLACASSDGRVSVLEFQEGNWSHQIFEAHGSGCNAVSWAPALAPGGMVRKDPDMTVRRRFVTGGSDCLVKIWDWNPQDQTYAPTLSLSGHTDWVRDVAWSPSTIMAKSYIASCSQDKTVRIWTNTPDQPGEWKATVLNFDAVLWRVSWSLSGNVLAVSGGDNKVSLWKEDLKGEWKHETWIEE